MQAYAHEENGFCRNPDTLVTAIRVAAQFANKGAGTHNVQPGDLIRFWGPYNPSPERRRNVVYEWLGGWGVANSQPHSSYTSLFGLAVWFDARDVLHFRCVADRLPCPRSPRGDVHLDPFGLHPRELFRVQPYVLVYPNLWVARPARGATGWLAATQRHLRADPLDTDAWEILADWYEDRDDRLASLSARIGAVFARRVIECLDPEFRDDQEG